MWPNANIHGVYDKCEAKAYEYEDSRIYLVIHTLQIAPNHWIYSFSFDKKRECKSGTMGVGSPLSKLNEISRRRGERDCISEQECLEKARPKVLKMVVEGLERGSASWKHTYNKLGKWANDLGRQYDLFAS